MELQTTVGASINANGAKPNLRSDKTGALVMTQAHCFYQEMSLGGNSYIGINPAGTPVVTQAGLSATTPALTLYNPIGSGYNLVIISAGISMTTSPAAACTIMLAYNLSSAAAPTATTLANVTNSMLGVGRLPVGQCYRIATLAAAPVAFRLLGGNIGASPTNATKLDDKINGEVIITPGVAVSFQTTSAASLLCSISWEEISI